MRSWVEGRVVERFCWAEDLYSLFVKAPIDPFTAGQFTQIGLGDQEKPLFRPYSFVNSPKEEVLEFYFNHVEEGVLTPQLINLQPDDSLWVAQKPTGRFTLDNLAPAKVLWCIATGTGLGVYLSLLKTQDIWQSFEHIVLIHSVSYGKFLTHTDLIQSFIEQYGEKFRYVPIVTREGWDKSYQQRITSLVSDGVIEKDLDLPIQAEDAQVMLCGNANMITEMRGILAQRNMTMRLPKRGGHVTIESYYKP